MTALEMTVEPSTAATVMPKPWPIGMLRGCGSVTTMGLATVALTMFTVSVIETIGAEVYPLPWSTMFTAVILPIPVDTLLSTVTVPVACVPPGGGGEMTTEASPAS